MVLLSAAGFCCCAAMAMPFVHMVAFCGDLGLQRRARQRGGVADPGHGHRRRPSPWAGWPTTSGRCAVSLLCSLIQIVSLVGFVFVGDSLTGIYTLSLIHGIPYIAIVQGYALILR